MHITEPITFTALTRYAKTEQPIYVMDIETTGLSLEHEIVEIGVHRLADGFTWNTLVKPERTRADETAHITGITDDMVKDAPDINEALHELDHYAPLDNALIVAHNGHYFDVPRINHARENAFSVDGVIETGQVIDTLYLAHKIIPWGGIADYKLTTLLEYFDLPSDQRHRAGEECEDTARVLSRLLAASSAMTVPPETITDLVDMSVRPVFPTSSEKEVRRLLKLVRKELAKGTVTPENRRWLIRGYEDMYYQCYGALPDLRSL